MNSIGLGDRLDESHSSYTDVRYFLIYRWVPDRLATRHNEGGNDGFVEGHTKWYSANELGGAEGHSNGPWRYNIAQQP